MLVDEVFSPAPDGWLWHRLVKGRTHKVHTETGPHGSYSIWWARAWRSRGEHLVGCIWFIQNLGGQRYRILAYVVPERADSTIHIRLFTKEATRRAHKDQSREVVLAGRLLMESIRDKVTLPEYLCLAVSEWARQVDRLTWEEEE
jgi:hypothetical protein